MEAPKTLKDMSEMELKAMKCDIYETQKRLEMQLNAIHFELSTRTQLTPEKPKPDNQV